MAEPSERNLLQGDPRFAQTQWSLVMKAAGQDLSMTIEKIEYNPEFPKDKFDPPAEVKALMNKPAK